MGTPKEIWALYEARWGEPARTATFKAPGGLSIEVGKWLARDTRLDVDVYATVGGSHADMMGGPEGHRVEFFIGLCPGNDDVASPLASIGLYPHRERARLDHGHTVPSEGPVWPGTEMSSFLITRQRNAVLPAVRLTSGAHLEFLQLTPLYESERLYKAATSAEALMAVWDELEVPYWDPNRREVRLPDL